MRIQAKTLGRWLRRVLGTDNPVVDVELVQMGAKSGLSVLETIHIDDPVTYSIESELEKLLERLLETAQEDADGWGGVTRYLLRGTDAEGNVFRSPVIRLASETDDIEGSEPADTTGALAQTQRHLEVVMRQFGSLIGVVANQQSEMIARLAEENRRTEKTRLKTFSLLEEMSDNKAKREIEAAKEARKERNAARIIDSITPMLPGVVGRIAGMKKTDPKASPELATLKEIVKTLNMQQIEQLKAVFADNPQQGMALFELLQGLAEEETDDGQNGSDSDDGSASDGETPSWN